MRIKLMLLTIGLGVGGTETHILALASGIDRTKFDVTVCSLKSGGCVVEELRRRGLPGGAPPQPGSVQPGATPEGASPGQYL